MSDEPTPTPAAEPDPTTPEPNATGGTEPEPRDETTALRQEAANRRRQLRDAEQQRDQAMTVADALRSEVDRLHRQEVERVAAWRLQDPSDLWRAGVELADVRAEDGSIDGEQLNAVVTDLLSEKPHYGKTQQLPDLHAGARAPAPQAPESPFAQAFKEAARR